MPSKPRAIQGRNNSLYSLKKLLETSPARLNGKQENIVALLGLGGIGKSELANEYVRQCRHLYEGVWFIRAEFENTLHNDLEALGAAIGYKADLKPKQKALAVLQAVIERKKPWLIIYDNVTEQAAINDYLIPGPKLHYLITTRSSQWENINSFSVGLLGEQDALKLLRQVSGRNDKNLSKLVEKLKGYPLALVVAGAYLKNHHRATVKSYLESFETRLDDEYAPDYNPTRSPELKYPRSVLGSLSLSIDQLSDYAKDLLSLLSFLSPNDVWPELIEEGSKENQDLGAYPWPSFIDCINDTPQRLNMALAELIDFCLIEPKDDRITMHPLTQDVIRARLKTKGVLWADSAIRMINSLIPYDTTSPVNWSRLNRLAPHVEILLNYVPASKAADRAIRQIGSYFRLRGNYGQAIIFLKEALKISDKVNGATSSLHALTLNNLASTYKNNEQLEEAETCYLKALAIERNGNTLTNLAGLYRKMNRFENAEPLFLEAQELANTTLGESHPYYAITLGNLATLYDEWGKHVTLNEDKRVNASKYIKLALDITTRAHGHWHQDTAYDLNNLAFMHAQEDHRQKAMDMMRRAVATRLDVLGQDHPYTKVSLNTWLDMLIESGADESQTEAAMQSLPKEIAALRADHVKWGLEKIAELQTRYDVQGLEALQDAIDAEYTRLKKDGAPVEKYQWVRSEFQGAVFALTKGKEWGLVDPEMLG